NFADIVGVKQVDDPIDLAVLPLDPVGVGAPEDAQVPGCPSSVQGAVSEAAVDQVPRLVRHQEPSVCVQLPEAVVEEVDEGPELLGGGAVGVLRTDPLGGVRVGDPASAPRGFSAAPQKPRTTSCGRTNAYLLPAV